MMTTALLAAAMIGQTTKPEPFKIQYGKAVAGRNVQLSINGGRVHTGFAGKLAFRDQNRSWSSYCAQVSSPIVSGQYFMVILLSSKKKGGNIAKAGNIVAKFFSKAQTADQCAGLQLAIWEAIEDGGTKPNFLGGKFQAQGSREVMAFAEEFYGAVSEDGDAIYLEHDWPNGGQDQITT